MFRFVSFVLYRCLWFLCSYSSSCRCCFILFVALLSLLRLLSLLSFSFFSFSFSFRLLLLFVVSFSFSSWLLVFFRLLPVGCFDGLLLSLHLLLSTVSNLDVDVTYCLSSYCWCFDTDCLCLTVYSLRSSSSDEVGVAMAAGQKHWQCAERRLDVTMRSGTEDEHWQCAKRRLDVTMRSGTEDGVW